ncbi:type I-E CRISPR-associated endoribonuclease Cas2e [Nocardiopsis alborubida]|uniref:Type I-E CRISPR-associated endoribonuclease Cas2 n=1 Tax=Nocardiopsis alborubida TaxID=146802 RepID=A0A7X6MFZ0_9ACTN|nr:type I-E CRISPR-associated endoribonuclease Cas2e [Nocardiopsis alborubida]NKZ00877.1 type I-E CRISPR-associated endoribonuclease Cas2 [Nocardiopsis alborubida]
MGSMVVIATTAVPDRVRGALSRWMTEPDAGLYVGTMNARVRQELWSAVSASVGDGAAVCLHTADNEQGYVVLTAGERRRQVLDFDGLQLIRLTAQVNEEEDPEWLPEAPERQVGDETPVSEEDPFQGL